MRYTRRAVIVAALAALVPGASTADERGSRRMARDNRMCAALGPRLERGGLTARERAHLARRGCGKDAVLGWVSTRVYPAGGGER